MQNYLEDALQKAYPKAVSLAKKETGLNCFPKQCPYQVQQILDDNFYPTIFEKAAYLFCGLIEGHYFSNGNKRLALMSTVFFLGLNGYDLSDILREEGIKRLKKSFPFASLSIVPDIPEVVPELSYHLCKIVADSPTHQMRFDTLKKTVEQILSFLFIKK